MKREFYIFTDYMSSSSCALKTKPLSLEHTRLHSMRACVCAKVNIPSNLFLLKIQFSVGVVDKNSYMQEMLQFSLSTMTHKEGKFY